MRILIVKPSSIGDVIHTFPAVAFMRRRVPGIESITWVVNDALEGVARLCPGVDAFIPFPRAKCLNWSALRGFVRELQARQYDLCIDYQGLLRSGLISHFSKAECKLGFQAAREFATLFYDKCYVHPTLESHAVEKNLGLTAWAFGIEPPTDQEPIRLNIPEAGRQEANSFLGTEGKCLAVCFSSRWESKDWRPEFIADVLKSVAAERPELPICLLGSKDDAEKGERIAELAAAGTVMNLAGKTTFQGLAAILARANAMFTVDSGPMHLAAVQGVPCIAMFGATKHVRTGPYGPDGLHTILQSACDQSPCMKRRCPRHCNCSDGVSVKEATERVLSKLL